MEIFNVCADKHPDRKTFYTKQALQQGLEPPTFSANIQGDFKIVSNQKLKDHLGYDFIHPDPMAF